MYKGNMQDFIDRLDEYLEKKYNSKLILGKYTIDGLTIIYIVYFHENEFACRGYKVYDREDFEQQVYDYVNHKINNHVQRELDGFSE